MCGITGFIDFKSQLKNRSLPILKKMTNAIIHRGPDADGHFISTDSRLALGHRRLSILDLSNAGSQPMFSTSRQYIIVFNGEIYNFKDLKSKLEIIKKITWRGNSDTEVLLEYIETYGFEETLKALNGMFSIALFDKKENKLFLARDRAGEKPLYYGAQGDFFYFGSELKSLVKHDCFDKQINRDALCSFLRHSYIPAPLSIYNGISKLLPGMFLEVNIITKEQKLSYYWDPLKVKQDINIFSGDEMEAKSELNKLLLDAVKIRMQSDVPLGAFLSGGIDSSLIVSLMQTQSQNRVKTFTIGFEEDQYNEAKFAKDVANHLKTDHTEMYVSSKQTLDVIPNLARYWDEPFADASQIPTFLVSQIAKSKVSVCLSGDGGDELFSGYDRYLWTEKIWNKIKVLPHFLRSNISTIVSKINPQTFNFLCNCIKTLSKNKLQFNNFSGKITKLSPALSSSNVYELYYSLLSHWSKPQNIVIDGRETINITNRIKNYKFKEEIIEWAMFCDFNNYLPDDILTKVDRATMAVSLEGRVPLLDHRVIEFSWKLPRNMRIKNGTTKSILRNILYDYVPKKLIDRPKKGFSIPMDTWLKGPLKEWACDLLSEDKLKREGYFNPKPIITKLNEYLKGNGGWHYHLWDILMFELWLDEQSKP
ncbi:MAG: asparagine synthase (glutamine-hydrolyzing) [Candidatus Cloacimonadota bacterium]|nr:MAG: asparagine synthase (glutamine-hydrolyzing) [Candidatus Cloacimonadota bacterium]